MHCPFCDSHSLRISRFRFSDIYQLLLLRLPVRCRNCRERSYVPMAQAHRIRQASRLRRQGDRMRRAGENQAERES